MENAKKDKKLLIIIAATVVTIAIIAIACFSLAGKSNAMKVQLDLGNKYLTEMDYEQAILTFMEIIEVDPKNVEAYLGIAEAFLAIGDVESAMYYLEIGYEETGDEALLSMLEAVYESVGEPEAEAGDRFENENSGESGAISEAESKTEPETDAEVPNDENGSDIPEGGVYLVEGLDEDDEKAVADTLLRIEANPTDPEGYLILWDIYMTMEHYTAAKDAACACYHNTDLNEEDVLDFIYMASDMAGESENSESNTAPSQAESSEKKEVQVAWNQYSMKFKDATVSYLFTYDKEYVEPRKKENGTGLWMHFERDEVQEQFYLEKSESFEAFYEKTKANVEAYEGNTNIVFGEPYQVVCGDIVVNRFDYSMTQGDEKLQNPQNLKYQMLYVDLGDGIAYTGGFDSSDAFANDYVWKHDIKLDDYLAYMFVAIDIIE